MKISVILNQIDLGSMALPEFQRGYVWNREQVRGFMYSLYRKHPVGSLLVWLTKSEYADVKGKPDLPPGVVELILDGQQRITSLYGIINGRPPKFFDGNDQTFTGLCFNLEEEIFEFYAPVKMKDNPLWINVTEFMKIGPGAAIQRIMAMPELQSNINTYINRITALDTIKEIELHIEKVTGEEKTVDVVVDIFNQVNSGGTKLSKGDLALAKICAQWPDARVEMKNRLNKWEKAGFNFKLDWFLRNINAILTGRSLFTALQDVDTAKFQKGLKQAEKSIDSLLNIISCRLGLDHDRVLGSKYSLPLMSRYLVQRGVKQLDFKERDELLYWYIHSLLWGRYSGSTESVLSEDLRLIEDTEGALGRLIEQLRQDRGDLRIQPNDFRDWSRGSRFYPLLYMMSRVCKAKDWNTGIELSSSLLGKLNNLQLHHIFPKALLYKHGYNKAEVNAIANFTFLTQETNLLISDRSPVEYLEEFIKKQPGAVESHWIPMDRELWKVENYIDFLAARRELLAKAANDFLDSLYVGSIPEVKLVPGGVKGEEEEKILMECNEWVTDEGFAEGEYLYELVDEKTGQVLAIIDLAWPNGIQEHLTEPVALLIDEDSETQEIVNRAGFHYFTDVDSFSTYVMREIVAKDEEVA